MYDVLRYGSIALTGTDYVWVWELLDLSLEGERFGACSSTLLVSSLSFLRTLPEKECNFFFLLSQGLWKLPHSASKPGLQWQLPQCLFVVDMMRLVSRGVVLPMRKLLKHWNLIGRPAHQNLCFQSVFAKMHNDSVHLPQSLSFWPRWNEGQWPSVAVGILLNDIWKLFKSAEIQKNPLTFKPLISAAGKKSAQTFFLWATALSDVVWCCTVLCQTLLCVVVTSLLMTGVMHLLGIGSGMLGTWHWTWESARSHWWILIFNT